jgi:hypothetical protein
MIGLMMVVSLSFCGCCVIKNANKLITVACAIEDPRVVKYHAAYLHENELVLEYSVRHKLFDRERRYADKYWARINLDGMTAAISVDGIPEMDRSRYAIYRKPLAESHKKAMTPIQFVVLPECPGFKTISYEERMRGMRQRIAQIPATSQPQVFLCGSRKQFDDPIDCVLRCQSPPSRSPCLYSICLERKFIPVSQYPKALILYPVAVSVTIAGPITEPTLEVFAFAIVIPLYLPLYLFIGDAGWGGR